MGNAMAWAHELALPSEPVSVSRARHFVGVHLVEHGLSSLVDDARLVMSELASNAIRHARTPFSVAVCGLVDDSVLVTVRDGSRDVPTLTKPVVLAEAGRGLWIVDHLSQDWGVESRGDGTKTLWASFVIPLVPGSSATR